MVAAVDYKAIEANLLSASNLRGVEFEQAAVAALKTLSVENIQVVSSSCKDNLKTMLLSVLCSGITVELPDSRDQALKPGATPFGPHKVTRFFVHAGRGTVEHQVRILLTEHEVKSLTADLKLDFELPNLSELAYFWNSHDKARNHWSASWRDKTTQQDDFNETGYGFGNDRVAVLFCARLVSRARALKLNLTMRPADWAYFQADIFNLFSAGEREILKQLKTAGIRTVSGALKLCRGRLRVDPSSWPGPKPSPHRAFGSPLSA